VKETNWSFAGAQTNEHRNASENSGKWLNPQPKRRVRKEKEGNIVRITRRKPLTDLFRVKEGEGRPTVRRDGRHEDFMLTSAGRKNISESNRKKISSPLT